MNMLSNVIYSCGVKLNFQSSVHMIYADLLISLFEIEILCNTMNAIILLFDKFNVSLVNKRFF